MQRKTPRRAAMRSALGLLMLCACYRPELSECIRCSTRCPEGRTCVDGFCAPNQGACSALALDGSAAPEEHVDDAPDAGEHPASGDTLLAASMCHADRCCIADDGCFALEPGARVALWLDWSSTRTEQGQFLAWRDRSGHGHDATSQSLKARPHVQSVGSADARILSFAMADTLSVAEADDDPLDRLLSGDFYALVAFAPDCPLSVSCLLGKHAQSEGLGLGLGQAGRLISFLQCEKPAECKAPEDAPVSTRGCGKSMLLSARYSRRSESELVAELRLEGQVVERRPFTLRSPATHSGPLQIGGGLSPQWNAPGQFALVAVVSGPVSAAKACEIERAAAQALVRAGIRTDSTFDCVSTYTE